MREKQHATSHQRARQPGAPQTRHRFRQGISRAPIETLSLREGRDHERQILGLSRSQNEEAQFPHALGAAAQRRRRAQGLTYSRFAEGLKAAGIGLDRKILSDLAITDEASFKSIVETVKGALEKKSGESKKKKEAA